MGGDKERLAKTYQSEKIKSQFKGGDRCGHREETRTYLPAKEYVKAHDAYQCFCSIIGAHFLTWMVCIPPPFWLRLLGPTAAELVGRIQYVEGNVLPSFYFAQAQRPWRALQHCRWQGLLCFIPSSTEACPPWLEAALRTSEDQACFHISPSVPSCCEHCRATNSRSIKCTTTCVIELKNHLQ